MVLNTAQLRKHTASWVVSPSSPSFFQQSIKEAKHSLINFKFRFNCVLSPSPITPEIYFHFLNVIIDIYNYTERYTNNYITHWISTNWAHLCNWHPDQNPHHCVLSRDDPPTSLKGNSYHDFKYFWLLLLVFELYICGIIKEVLFLFPSHIKIFIRFNHLFKCNCKSSIHIAKQYFTV